MGQKQEEVVDSLLILGNGFDLAHDMKTGWSHFQSFWLENIHSPQSSFVSHAQGCLKCQKFEVPCPEGWKLIDPENCDLASDLYNQGHHEEGAFVQLCSIAMEAGRRTGSAKLLWSDFEDNLSRGTLPNIDDYGWDETGDYESKYVTTLDNAGAEIRGTIDSKLRSWLNFLDLDVKPNSKLKTMLDDYDRIINFNYTPTLAIAYGIDDSSKVVQVHGSLATGNIVYGHSRDFHPEMWPTGMNALEGQETSDHLNHLKKQLNTEVIGESLKSAKRAGLSSIASYGFSFGIADKEYMALFAREYCSKDTVWTQYYHEEPDIERAKAMLDEAHFPGEIKHIRDDCFAP